MNAKLLGVVATILVAGLVVAGLFAAGSPNTARNIRADQETENRLNGLQYQLTEYERNNGRFPKNLAELDSEVDRVKAKNFDETPIEYRRISDGEYEVCAVFLTSSDDPRRSGYYDTGAESFAHGEGRTCFRRKSSSRFNKFDNRGRPIPQPFTEKPVPID